MNTNISETFVFSLCLAALMLAVNIEIHAAPLPEKIISSELQRTDCITQDDEAGDGFAPYIEEFVFIDDHAGISLYSCVNWRDGVLKSEGVGKKQSRRAAELVARNNALKTLIVMNVNADATLQTYFQRQKDVLLKIQNVLIKSATIQDLPADPETPDEAKVLVTIPFYGISGLVSFFLNDQEIYMPTQTTQSDSGSNTGQSDATGYTGIVIDATALPLEPALFPQIVSEDGEVLYSASHVERDTLMQQGVVEYVREREQTVVWRAGGRPLIIRPVLLASAGPLTSADLPVSLPVMTTPSTMKAPWNILAEAKSREGRGKANALTVNAAETDGQQPVNVVVSLEDAQKIKQANAEQQVDRRGNYTVLIGREIGGVQGWLEQDVYAMQSR